MSFKKEHKATTKFIMSGRNQNYQALLKLVTTQSILLETERETQTHQPFSLSKRC